MSYPTHIFLYDDDDDNDVACYDSFFTLPIYYPHSHNHYEIRILYFRLHFSAHLGQFNVCGLCDVHMRGGGGVGVFTTYL